jgi:hypothetical protein
MPPLGDGESMLKRFAWESFQRWQFLMLNPERMGQPTPQQLATNRVTLARDGSNVAEYLYEIRSRDLAAFEGILDALRYVLPYAQDLQPSLTSELERAFYLKLQEGTTKCPAGCCPRARCSSWPCWPPSVILSRRRFSLSRRSRTGSIRGPCICPAARTPAGCPAGSDADTSRGRARTARVTGCVDLAGAAT